MTLKTSLTAILSVAAFAVAGSVAAQEAKPEQKAQTEQGAPSAQGEQQPAQIAAEDVTDAQVEAFVDAILAVEQVRNEYGAPIQAAEDEAAQQKLVEEANEAAFKAVGAVENMDIETYVAIATAAGESEDLNKRVIARISEIRQD